MTPRRTPHLRITAMGALIALAGLGAACTAPGATPAPSPSEAMMEESASPSGAMMEESASPSGAMMEESPSPSGS